MCRHGLGFSSRAYLERLGWKEGAGLGKESQGRSSHFRPSRKIDRGGLGGSGESPSLSLSRSRMERLFDEAVKRVHIVVEKSDSDSEGEGESKEERERKGRKGREKRKRRKRRKRGAEEESAISTSSSSDSFFSSSSSSSSVSSSSASSFSGRNKGISAHSMAKTREVAVAVTVTRERERGRRGEDAVEYEPKRREVDENEVLSCGDLVALHPVLARSFRPSSTRLLHSTGTLDQLDAAATVKKECIPFMKDFVPSDVDGSRLHLYHDRSVGKLARLKAQEALASKKDVELRDAEQQMEEMTASCISDYELVYGSDSNDLSSEVLDVTSLECGKKKKKKRHLNV